jgi:hypothetical protein
VASACSINFATRIPEKDAHVDAARLLLAITDIIGTLLTFPPGGASCVRARTK